MNHRASVWIIDDETEVASSLNQALQSKYDVQTFKNPAEVISLFRDGTRAPHAMISDIRMPKINGIEFMQQLRELRIDCPVILASGYAEKKEATAAINLGAFGLIEKPFLIAELQKMLDRAILKDLRDRQILEKLMKQTQQIEALQNLSDLYFDRLNMLQNQAKELNTAILTTLETRQFYLDSIKAEMVILSQIQKLKSTQQ